MTCPVLGAPVTQDRTHPRQHCEGITWGDLIPSTYFLHQECNEVKVKFDSVLRLLSTFFFFFKEHAFESSQKYKEGKFIIELAHMIKDNGWE